MSLKITVDVNIHFSPELLQFFNPLFKVKLSKPDISDAIPAKEYDDDLPPIPVKKPSAQALLKKVAPPVDPAENERYEQPAPVKKRAPRKKTDPADLADEDSADEEFTIDALRKLCAQKARAGFREEIRETLDSFGVDTLDDLPEEQYAEFAQAITALE